MHYSTFHALLRYWLQVARVHWLMYNVWCRMGNQITHNFQWKVTVVASLCVAMSDQEPLRHLHPPTRDALLKDLVASCITMLRVFSLAADLRPAATRQDDQEREEREERELKQRHDEQELYQQYCIYRDRMRADPPDAAEGDAARASRGSDNRRRSRSRSRNRDTWVGYLWDTCACAGSWKKERLCHL